MAVNGKGKTPDNRTWVVKTPAGKKVEDKKTKKPLEFNTYSEAASAARNHIQTTGEYAAAVTS